MSVTQADIEATKRFHITNNLIQILYELKVNVPDGWVEKWTTQFMLNLNEVEELKKYGTRLLDKYMKLYHPDCKRCTEIDTSELWEKNTTPSHKDCKWCNNQLKDEK